jgi:hypothetical protein
MGVSGYTATGRDWTISFVWLAGAGKGFSGLFGSSDQINQMNQIDDLGGGV